MLKFQILAEEFIQSSKKTQNSLKSDEEKTLMNLTNKVKEKDLIIKKN